MAADFGDLASGWPGTNDLKAEIARRKADRARREVEQRVDEIRERCQTFRGFIRESWHVLEPVTKYVECWHHGAIAEHMEAVTAVQITRLQINQPPGTMKSLIASVMFNPWEWGPAGLPGLRYFTSSYKRDYAVRDSRKSRTLILSEWYQALWPEVKLIRANEDDFETAEHGYRKAVAFESMTAGRGNRVWIDDPHSTENVESDNDREKKRRMFREQIPSRVNDPDHDAIMIIMHRLHPQDVCGVIDELGLPYVKLVLPMEYDPKTVVYSKYFEDPRKKAGELLCPQRVSAEVIEATKKEMTPHGYATQYQQQPSFRAGGQFKRHWFQFAKAIPAGRVSRARGWDLAGSIDGDWTVGVLIARTADRFFYIEDVIRFRDTSGKVRDTIKRVAKLDRSLYGRQGGVLTVIPQDPGQAGKDQVQSIISENAGYRFRAERQTGEKSTRAEPFAAQLEIGNVLMLEAEWNEAFIDEHAQFPQGHDDQVDATATAFNALASAPRMEIPDSVVEEAANLSQTRGVAVSQGWAPKYPKSRFR